jgi:hypothetical protein
MLTQKSSNIYLAFDRLVGLECRLETKLHLGNPRYFWSDRIGSILVLQKRLEIFKTKTYHLRKSPHLMQTPK